MTTAASKEPMPPAQMLRAAAVKLDGLDRDETCGTCEAWVRPLASLMHQMARLVELDEKLRYRVGGPEVEAVAASVLAEDL